MKKRVVIYTRVSTDDQKEHGYSLQEQESRLRRFCELNGYEIVFHFQDDHSAKNFDRPDFNNLLTELKTKKLRFDLLIVTKIDRFSRDVFESYAMLKVLDKYKIKVMTLAEGIIDFNDPQRFFSNLIFSGAAHHENLLRSDNTKRGMREALRKGRWMWKAPLGYKNQNKLCVPDDKIAPLIVEGFQLVAKGVYSSEEVRRILTKKGLRCSKNNFLNILKNPFYTGKIRIPEWKEEEEIIVPAIHKALIDDDTFQVVQSVIGGRGKKIAINVTRKEAFPLRGFLICAVCGKKLTASSSKSRNGTRHPYYHCESKNKCKGKRLKAINTNDAFVAYLESFNFRMDVLELYSLILMDTFKRDDESRIDEQKAFVAQIAENKTQLGFLKAEYLNQRIDFAEYKELKAELEERQKELVFKQSNIDQSSSYERYIDGSFSLLADLPVYYSKVALELKQKIVGSIFPENLTFDGINYRTTRTNEVVALITNNIKASEGVKKKQASGLADLSCLAPRAGLEPATP